jgi:hypothetical protein
MNYIQGQKFTSLVDGVYIHYRDTENVDSFFENEAPNYPFVLISHNGDGSVRMERESVYDASLSKAPPTLIKWFAQNVCVADPRIQSIPIGLENSKWFPELKKIEKINQITKNNKCKYNKIYCNFNIETNPKERLPAHKIASDLLYCTTSLGKNGFNYDDYISNLYHHDFVLCPAGNGEDTHRLWETLYVGSIPIVKKSINTMYYKDLPICYVDEWDEIKNEKFLNEEYEKILVNNSWNTYKLNFNYWSDFIKKVEINVK